MCEKNGERMTVTPGIQYQPCSLASATGLPGGGSIPWLLSMDCVEICSGGRERERERERDRDRDRERETETERDRDRERQRQRVVKVCERVPPAFGNISPLVWN